MRKFGVVMMHVVLIFTAILFVIPFYVMVRNALSTDAEITSFDWVWFPKEVQWKNVTDLFADPFVPMGRGFLNSTVITILTTTFQTAFACMAGYALARIPYKRSHLVMGLVLSTMMIPADALFVPSFALVAKLGWVNTFQGLIVPGLFSAFNTFMFRQHFMDFPKELEDAARVDGLGTFGIFRRIVVPNSWAIVTALASLTMVASWNSFLWPLVIGQSRNWWTVQVNLAVYLTAQVIRLRLLFAGALLGALPMLIAFFFLQRFIAEGIARTGIKG
jgi:multiple sugar transport system permease protein